MKYEHWFDTLRRMKGASIHKLIRKLKTSFLLFFRASIRRRDYWLRLGLAWGIGMAFLAFDSEPNLDHRLQLRGPQKVNSSIVLLLIPESSFWSFRNENKWADLLSKILKQNPKSIGVTIHPKVSNQEHQDSLRNLKTLSDDRIIWATQLDNEGRLLPSRFVTTHEVKSGLFEFRPDRDGSIRRFRLHSNSMPHMALQLANTLDANTKIEKTIDTEQNRLLNYRGAKNTFPSIDVRNLMNGTVAPDAFTDKIVILGLEDGANQSLETPVGGLSKPEILANAVDNILNARWVKIPPPILVSIFLFCLVLFSAWNTTHYPQVLSAVVLGTLLLSLLALTLSAFDLIYLFVPLIPQAVSVLSTYFIFTSFQLSIREYEKNQLEKEKDFLLDVEELKSNFLSLISHDLKTPIAKIQGICDRIMSRTIDEQLNSDVLALRQEAHELNRYIKTLLQVTRAEARAFELRADSMDINETIEAVCEQLSPLAQSKSIRLDLQLEPMFLIEADSLLIHEVIMNLVENAIKFSPENSTIAVRSHDVDDRVLVMIEDSGPGIPASEVNHIFDKFYRGEQGRAHQRGSGLGLYLVKYFVERHNGRVIIDSTPGRGTRIGFSLPIQVREDQVATEPSIESKVEVKGAEYEANT